MPQNHGRMLRWAASEYCASEACVDGIGCTKSFEGLARNEKTFKVEVRRIGEMKAFAGIGECTNLRQGEIRLRKAFEKILNI